jgi:hypothetical protein
VDVTRETRKHRHSSLFQAGRGDAACDPDAKLRLPVLPALPNRPNPADERKVTDDTSVPTWWPTEQAARPRQRRSVGGNGVPVIANEAWQPPTQNRQLPQAQSVATMLGDDDSRPRDLVDMLDDEAFVAPLGWHEPTVRPENGWIETQSGPVDLWRPAVVGAVNTPQQDVVGAPAPVSATSVPGAPIAAPVANVSDLTTRRATGFEATVIEAHVVGETASRRVEASDPTSAKSLPAMPKAPALPVLASLERFNISDALHVEEDTSIDPLNPQVIVIARFNWGKALRIASIVLSALTLLIVGVSFWQTHAASSRGDAVRAAAARALKVETLNGKVRYESGGVAYTGDVDAQRDPVRQHLVFSGPTPGTQAGNTSFETIWFDGDLYVRSPKSAAHVGDEWVLVRLAAQNDMRSRVDMASVLGTRTPEPLLPLRVLAKAPIDSVSAGRSEAVDGVDATRYTVTINTGAIRAKDDNDDVRRTVKQYGWTKAVKGDVWIDKSGQLVKFQFPYLGDGTLTVSLVAGTGDLSIDLPADAHDASSLPEFAAALTAATS